MVDDVIVYKQSPCHGSGSLYHPYRTRSAYGSSLFANGGDGDGTGDGEGVQTQGGYSGRGKGYDRGYGYKNGAGYEYRDSYILRDVLTTPARWTKEGLMPQRDDGAILVWKSVQKVENRNLWKGSFDWRYAVGERYVDDWTDVVPGPTTALQSKNYGDHLSYVMAIWAHKLMAWEGSRVRHRAYEGTPAAVYSMRNIDKVERQVYEDLSASISSVRITKGGGFDDKFILVDSDGTPDPLSLVQVEKLPFKDGKRVFYPPYRYKTKRTALQK